MAELPSASVRIDDEGGGFAGTTGFAVVLGAVATNPDLTPRVFSSAKALLAQHAYSAGADYAAMHIEETGLPVIFVGMPIATAGIAGSFDSSSVVGTSKISVAAASSGYLEEVDGVVTVVRDGTVGTDAIAFNLSLDGGTSEKLVRLGTSSSYTIPYLGIVLSFGAGTLVAGDEYTFRTTAPMWDGDGLSSARDALAAQLKQARSFVVVGDLPSSTFAGYVTTEANGYATENDRFVIARASVKDRRLAKMSKAKHSMVGSPTLTFAEVGATGDTITRSGGSWIVDGFAVGDIVTVGGSVSNNVTGRIASLSATVLTFDTTDLVNEGPVSNCTVVGSPSLTFAEVGSTGDTVTRSAGSWLDDGFAIGDTIAFTGTASNNVTGAITALSATVLTFGSTDLTAEEIASHLVTAVQVQTMSAYVSASEAAFAAVDGQRRIDLSIGRGRKQSPITGWSFRRPAGWAASLREYQHDVQITTWWKQLGPLDGWSLEDSNGNVVEYDERLVGGALAARFTCFRTWSNGPRGAFIAQSLTRADEGSLLSMTHNMAVVNLACTIVQLESEMAIGSTLVLNSDGTATDASRQIIEERVNSKLQIGLLQAGSEGQRASGAVWRLNPNTVLNVTNATWSGVLSLLLNGTLVHIDTVAKVQTAG